MIATKNWYIVFFLLLLWLNGFSQPAARHYKAGDTFPDLVFSPIGEREITTSSLRGKKFLLTFNRYVSCPLCNYRAHELMGLLDSVGREKFLIISVYESERKQLEEYTRQEEIPFLMIPDPDEYLYKQFKVTKSWWRSFTGLFNHYHQKHSQGKKLFKSTYKRDGHLNRIGADFLVNEYGVIVVAYYGKFVGDHLDIAEIRDWVNGQ